MLDNNKDSVVYDGKRPIPIKQSKLISSPCVIGVFKPTILLPDTMFTDEEFQFIIEHELLHIRRQDVLLKIMLEMMIIVYWWNPMIYLFRKNLAHILELNVDETLLKNSSKEEKIEYVELLLKVQKNSQQITSYDPVTVNFSYNSEEGLLHRSQNILKSKKKQYSTFVLLIISILGFLLTTSIVFESLYLDSEKVEGTFTITPSNSYFVEKTDGTYDIYRNDTFLINIENIHQAGFEDIPVFELPQGESND
ncbi:M56 family metallopeptidase [Fundicoccus culcitae]|uniref:M56 family metallopeptidase n=1 Tax=Fundicoccus culcitae TaxID=2969821 RepID=A0ABY5P7W5_9LACT|nr:M56 family metallopeptidase [Fundicoccus culcitae]UUX34483.1 M56 family metallopeptidase [Fundicoccus culcitae]